MPAQRCSTCGTNWPTDLAGRKCPDCGSQTWYTGNETPDKQPPLLAPADGLPPLPPPNPAAQHRGERFMQLGFSEPDALLLAAAKDGHGFPIYHGDVAKFLQAGCTHTQAVGIFA